MATLHLICGLPCSGKTTLAKQLEAKFSALRLTPDEWHTRLFGQDAEESAHDERHTIIEGMLWEIAARVLSLGVNVVLDFGFWSRAEREDFRTRATKLGAGTQLHSLDVSADESMARLHERNAAPPDGAFLISEDQLRAWIAAFETPTEEELARN